MNYLNVTHNYFVFCHTSSYSSDYEYKQQKPISYNSWVRHYFGCSEYLYATEMPLNFKEKHILVSFSTIFTFFSQSDFLKILKFGLPIFSQTDFAAMGLCSTDWEKVLKTQLIQRI